MASKDLAPLTASWPRILLRSQIHYGKIPAPPANTNLQGKVAIVTGATTGIGYECARQLLSLKLSHLIITCRDQKRGDDAASKLRVEHSDATVEAWVLEMCTYESVQAFVKKADSKLSRLDIAILNAGRSKTTFDLVSSTGHEENVQVNYLSTMLLTTLLLPVMKARASPDSPGRISIVTSGSVLSAKFANRASVPLLKSFDDPKTGPSGLEAYATSKLLGHMFVYRLVEYVSPDDVIVNLVDPGGTKGTGLGRDLPKVVQTVILPLVGSILRTVEDAAHTYLNAVLVRGKESHGCFIMDDEIRP